MSMIASDNGGSSIPKLEGGVYTAISSAIVDLGLQKNEKFDKTQRKFMMIWTILNETIEVNGEQLPRQLSKEYSFSLHEKSTLRKDLQAWRGKAFTEEELRGFNILNVLNVPCQLQVLLEERNGRQYNNIASIMALPKGSQVEKLENTYYFDIETMDSWTNWTKIPQWIRDRIKRAENFKSTGLEEYVSGIKENNEPNNEESDMYVTPEDDLPF